MPLSSQRFRDNETLRNCADQVPPYRMRRGERDREAVKHVQFALHDLCYPQIAGSADVDGTWGDLTDEAVIQINTEEGVSLTDPLAAKGTIGQLDEYFAWESPYPDHPDPGAYGLVELAEAYASEGAAVAGRALKVLEGLSWGGPPISAQEEVRSALMAYAGVDAGSSSHTTGEYRAHLLTLLGAFQIFLAPWTGWRGTRRRAPRTTGPYSQNVAEHGYLGTRRHGYLTPEQKRLNKLGRVCLILFAGAGITEQVHMPPTWGDLSSLPG